MGVQRTFFTGSEWLYYKIYCGARTADHILVETIQPLTERFVKNHWIDRWFFIRYEDTDHHLRVRFHCQDTKHIGSIIKAAHEALAPLIDQDRIHKIQTDTYVRELERYGIRTIEIAEELFFYESELLLQAIDRIEDENLYFLFVVKVIDSILEDFHYSLSEKLALAKANRDAFKKEFNADKKLTKQLHEKYKTHQNTLSQIMELTPDTEFGELHDMLEKKRGQSLIAVQTILGKHQHKTLEVPLSSLLSSYIHMLVNRAFRSQQRFYELVSYDFLSKYYTTQYYRNSK